MSTKLRLGITVGDFNGIGPELILKTLSNSLLFNYCTPVVYGNKFVFNFYAKLLDIDAIHFNVVRKESDIKDGVVNLRKCNDDKIDITPGIASVQAGKFAYDALNLAVDDIKTGIIQNIVTAPIDKSSTVEAGLQFNGHTGFFEEAFNGNAQMILLNDKMKVAMVTGHKALNQVSESLTSDSILESISQLNSNLIADFGIEKPRIAVLAANPHSGDNGLMGSEEITAIHPAIKLANEQGILAIGPFPPDGFFGSDNAKQFDAVLGMYHDQILIPFKQIAFHDGVNYTAGLPMIRTSPDHGTAYNIAGKGLANISSFVNAIYWVNRIHRSRIEFYDSSVSPLPFKDHRREKFSIGVPNLK